MTCQTRCTNTERGHQPFPMTMNGRNTNIPLIKLRSCVVGEATVYCYIVASIHRQGEEFVQRGSGPNFQGDLITLCTCKHRMRTFLAPEEWSGIWIAGFTSRPTGGKANYLFYLMQVAHAFESQRELWFSRDILPAAKQAKAAHLDPFGDLYKPRSRKIDRWDPAGYLSPTRNHPHAGDWARRHSLRRRWVSACSITGRGPAEEFSLEPTDDLLRGPTPSRADEIHTEQVAHPTSAGRTLVKIALLRIGIDTGSGGIHGPLFQDGSFEYIPIPDDSHLDERTYGNTRGRHREPLVTYFPESRRSGMVNQSLHFDPEFGTFTYGDPTPPKAGLCRLERGDMLVFYCGLQGWGFESAPRFVPDGLFRGRGRGPGERLRARRLDHQVCQQLPRKTSEHVCRTSGSACVGKRLLEQPSSEDCRQNQ